ncbi:MAG: IS1 family transposase [Thermodesulfobacteriota bacterium]
MNKLSLDKQTAVVSALVEGSSIRSVEGMTRVHRDTIMRLMVRVAQACEGIMDREMWNLPCRRIQLDEIGCYVGKKQRHVRESDDPSTVGDFWTWVALDAETKLVPVYRVGKRDSATAHALINDLDSRLRNRIQLSSDKLPLYVEAIEQRFGADVDYAQIVEAYEAEPIGPGRYSPPKVVSVEKTRVLGSPDMDMTSTSFVERQNLTMRMNMRGFTRLTNAFSKKVENLKAAVALHFAHYNFVRVHKTLKVTPAMEAGIAREVWSLRTLVGMATS